MIGALAIIAILAAVLLPALIKEVDKLVADQEVATLQSFGTAIQNNVLRTRNIPDDMKWVSVITAELGMSSSLVSTNTRSRARLFVIDATGFSPIVLPYTQTSGGVSTPPSQARFMIVSSVGASLPAGLSSRPGQTIFNDLWNTAPNAMPANAIWSGWNGGRSEDLLVQRINLSPCFVHLILTTNNSIGNFASYCIDSGATNSLGACNAYYIQGSVLNLYSNAVSFPSPDSQQILQRDVSFVYDQNIWRSSIVSVSTANTNPPDFSGIVNAFVNAGPTSVNPPPSQIANDFITYMSAYIAWATNGFPNNQLKTTALGAYNTMKNDVNGLVNAVQP